MGIHYRCVKSYIICRYGAVAQLGLVGEAKQMHMYV